MITIWSDQNDDKQRHQQDLDKIQSKWLSRNWVQGKVIVFHLLIEWVSWLYFLLLTASMNGLFSDTDFFCTQCRFCHRIEENQEIEIWGGISIDWNTESLLLYSCLVGCWSVDSQCAWCCPAVSQPGPASYHFLNIEQSVARARSWGPSLDSQPLGHQHRYHTTGNTTLSAIRSNSSQSYLQLVLKES